MRASLKGGPTLPLIVFCLQGMAWSLGLSKDTVWETEIRNRPDSVFIHNRSNNPIHIHTLLLKLSRPQDLNWEFSLRSNRSPGEICFGRGEGTCPPASPEGSVKTGWVVPPGDSLILSDFNLAECIRCPLAGSKPRAGSGDLPVPLILRSGNGQDTLVLQARLGAASTRALPPVPAAPARPEEGKIK